MPQGCPWQQDLQGSASWQWPSWRWPEPCCALPAPQHLLLTLQPVLELLWRFQQLCLLSPELQRTHLQCMSSDWSNNGSLHCKPTCHTNADAADDSLCVMRRCNLNSQFVSLQRAFSTCRAASWRCLLGSSSLGLLIHARLESGLIQFLCVVLRWHRQASICQLLFHLLHSS